jgi:hypothetical protein
LAQDEGACGYFFVRIGCSLTYFFIFEEQIRAPGCGSAERLFFPPTLDHGVIAAEKYLGHAESPEFGGSGVVRVFDA